MLKASKHEAAPEKRQSFSRLAGDGRRGEEGPVDDGVMEPGCKRQASARRSAYGPQILTGPS